MQDKKLTSSGSKAYQCIDDTNPDSRSAKPYSDWHRTLSSGLYMLDVDSIEWRSRNGKIVPVGVLELTRTHNIDTMNDAYLNSIVQRYERDLQGRTSKMVASALNTKAYIVLFRGDCSEFWIYNLTDKSGWTNFNQSGMESCLKAL